MRQMGTVGSAGLRERKKQRTHDDLQAIATRLFLERGYHDVTIDQIVAEADVSHRTFYRYFGSKEDLVLGDVDELLDALREALAERPADEPVLDSIRAAIGDLAARFAGDEAEDRARTQLIRDTPVLHQRSIERQPLLEAALVPFIAGRLGLDADRDLLPRVLAACAMAATGVAIDQWSAGEGDDALVARLDGALQLLADGFGSALRSPAS